MGLISWIAGGFFSTWIVYTIRPKSYLGCLGDMLIGGIGGLAGGVLYTLFFPIPNQFYDLDMKNILFATLFAVVLLILYRFAASKINVWNKTLHQPGN